MPAILPRDEDTSYQEEAEDDSLEDSIDGMSLVSNNELEDLALDSLKYDKDGYETDTTDNTSPSKPSKTPHRKASMHASHRISELYTSPDALLGNLWHGAESTLASPLSSLPPSPHLSLNTKKTARAMGRTIHEESKRQITNAGTHGNFSLLDPSIHQTNSSIIFPPKVHPITARSLSQRQPQHSQQTENETPRHPTNLHDTQGSTTTFAQNIIWESCTFGSQNSSSNYQLNTANQYLTEQSPQQASSRNQQQSKNTSNLNSSTSSSPRPTENWRNTPLTRRHAPTQ